MARKIEDPLERRVLSLLRRERLAAGEAPLVVAFSGGADSLALLACCVSLARLGAISPVPVAAHFDHGLRPGSRADATAAKALAVTLGAPFRGGRARGLARARGSMEALARKARYRFLERVLREVGATRLATAHTRDDRVETVLHRVLQGGNLAGLSGIPLRRPLRAGTVAEVVRPFHETTRREIDVYLARQGLQPIVDPTNATGMNARARLRREVLPVLRAVYPGCDRALLNLEETAREARETLETGTGPGSQTTSQCPTSDFIGLGLEGVRQRLKPMLAAAAGEQVEIPRAGIERLRRAVNAQPSDRREVPLGSGWLAVLKSGKVGIHRAE